MLISYILLSLINVSVVADLLLEESVANSAAKFGDKSGEDSGLESCHSSLNTCEYPLKSLNFFMKLDQSIFLGVATTSLCCYYVIRGDKTDCLLICVVFIHAQLDYINRFHNKTNENT